MNRSTSECWHSIVQNIKNDWITLKYKKRIEIYNWCSTRFLLSKISSSEKLPLSLSLYINVCITFFITLLLFVRDDLVIEFSKLDYELFHEQIMSDEEDEQNYFIPHRRTFHIENIPQWKISLFDEKSQLDINRIVLPIDSNVVLEKIMEIQPVVTEQHRPSMEHSVRKRKHYSKHFSNLFSFRQNISRQGCKIYNQRLLIHHQKLVRYWIWSMTNDDERKAKWARRNLLLFFNYARDKAVNKWMFDYIIFASKPLRSQRHVLILAYWEFRNINHRMIEIANLDW